MVKWQFHPKPFSKPISVAKALGIDPRAGTVFRHDTKDGRRIPPTPYLFSQPCITIIRRNNNYFIELNHDYLKPEDLKYFIQYGSETRFNTLGLKRLATFPDNYKFSDNPIKAAERIGNSVPPKLTEAIGENFKLLPFIPAHNPTFISLFAGCGGSSTGYINAGFKELLAAEWDKDAYECFLMNYPDCPVFKGDVRDLSVEKIIEMTGLKVGELDLLDSSPPCQGFSVIGKRELNDPRNFLYLEVCRILKGLQPKVFMMENVKGMIMGGHKTIADKIYTHLGDCGYKVKVAIMNTAYFGVPQKRERVIFIGVRNDLVKEIDCE